MQLEKCRECGEDSKPGQAVGAWLNEGPATWCGITHMKEWVNKQVELGVKF